MVMVNRSSACCMENGLEEAGQGARAPLGGFADSSGEQRRDLGSAGDTGPSGRI